MILIDGCSRFRNDCVGRKNRAGYSRQAVGKWSGNEKNNYTRNRLSAQIFLISRIENKSFVVRSHHNISSE